MKKPSTSLLGNEQGQLKKATVMALNIIKLIGVLALCTVVSMVFRSLGAHETNIVLVYLLGILLYSNMTGSYQYSLLASLFGVLFYNFFFTVPYYTLQAYRPDYPITFLIMFLVGAFTSMLTIRIKRETLLAEEKEARIKALYQIGRRLLGVKSSANLAEVSAEELAAQFSADVMVQFFDTAGKNRNRFVKGCDLFQDDKERIVIYEVYQSGNPSGRGTKLFSDARAYYLPIINQNGIVGIIGIAPPEAQVISGVQMEFLDTISTQIAVVLEREMLYQKQAETQIQIQRERLRTDMLRTISHDLRTPLTGIMGSASTVIDNFDSVGDDIKKSFLKNIYDDASWLSDLVENVLNMTRFEEGNIKLNIGQEAAEEIVAEAISHVKRHADGHKLTTNIPLEIILLEADGVLITQVLVNLLDNAINYTPNGSEITVSLSRMEEKVVFEVSDDGPGISQEDLPHMFERLYSRHSKAYGSRLGFGLGLSLCKSIVQAHGGTISIKNIEPHGTAVAISIPAKEDKENAASHFSR